MTRPPPNDFSAKVDRQAPTQGRTRWKFPLVEENGEVRLELSGTGALDVDGGRGLMVRVDPSAFEVRHGSPYSIHAKLDKSMRITKKGLAAVPEIADVPMLKQALDEKAGAADLALKADQSDVDADLALKANSSDLANGGRGYPVNANQLEGSDLATVIAAAVAQAMIDVHPLMGVVTLDGTGSTTFIATGALKGAPVVVSYDRSSLISPSGLLSAHVTNDDELVIDSVLLDQSDVFYCIARFGI